nr:MAG: hypothetical protein DIU57_16855 [Pseudomonadota bacterium]
MSKRTTISKSFCHHFNQDGQSKLLALIGFVLLLGADTTAEVQLRRHPILRRLRRKRFGNKKGSPDQAVLMMHCHSAAARESISFAGSIDCLYQE